MDYISTRGLAPPLGFDDALLSGLAPDGGLYVPEAWPELGGLLHTGAFTGQPYAEAASEAMRPFTASGAGEADELLAILRDAYAPFRHPAVAPLVQIGPREWILELFRGPTLAFKDIAMQVLARLMERALRKRGAWATIVAATSGDTGGAAVEAFRGRGGISLFVLYPHERISEVQRRQMTAAQDSNVHVLAIRGTFDDCQALVKALFRDASFRSRARLAAVNSINWARILAQTVYYFTSAAALGAPFRSPTFVVPTGNFGNIFAGFAARQMGLPIGRLVIATNVNDILTRLVKTGRYEPREVIATGSPAMDIQMSSNFERLLFELGGRDPVRVRALMGDLQEKGSFTLSEDEQAALSEVFLAERADEAETCAAIARLYRETGYAADPHTAVGLAVAAKLGLAESVPGEVRDPVVVLATAHPAKFPGTVAAATGRQPEEPEALGRLRGLPERLAILDNDLKAVKEFIEARAVCGSLT